MSTRCNMLFRRRKKEEDLEDKIEKKKDTYEKKIERLRKKPIYKPIDDKIRKGDNYGALKLLVTHQNGWPDDEKDQIFKANYYSLLLNLDSIGKNSGLKYSSGKQDYLRYYGSVMTTWAQYSSTETFFDKIQEYAHLKKKADRYKPNSDLQRHFINRMIHPDDEVEYTDIDNDDLKEGRQKRFDSMIDMTERIGEELDIEKRYEIAKRIINDWKPIRWIRNRYREKNS